MKTKQVEMSERVCYAYYCLLNKYWYPPKLVNKKWVWISKEDGREYVGDRIFWWDKFMANKDNK